MNTSILKILVTTTTLFFASLSQAQVVPKGEYSVDPAHSKVGFEVAHLVISSVEGKFTKFSGVVKLDEKLEKSSVKASAEVASIDTSNADRDKHLRSADFFNAEKNPKIEFESTDITGSADNLIVTGNLTIKGVTKKVSFEGKYLGKVNDSFGNEKVAFRLKTKVIRKDFGLVYGNITEAGPVIGAEVTIDLNIQAARPLKKK